MRWNRSAAVSLVIGAAFAHNILWFVGMTAASFVSLHVAPRAIAKRLVAL